LGNRRGGIAIKNARIAIAFLAGFASGTAAGQAPTATYRLLLDPSRLGYQQPSAIAQITPDTFLVNVDAAAILSVTTAKQGAVLVQAASQGGLAPPIAASNGRGYTAFGGRDSNSGTHYVISYTVQPGSAVSYAQQSIGPNLTAGLPDGTLLGHGSDAGNYYHLITSDLQGSLTSLYTLGANEVNQTPPFVASDGDYYGVSYVQFGPGQGNAYIYQLTPGGEFTRIADLPPGSFSYNGNGSALFQAADGNLYGTTLTGGKRYGTFYRVTLSGQYTLLYTFPAKSHNSFPGNMFQASDGNFYGVANGCCSGGPADIGTIFQLTPSLQYTALVSMKGDKGQCPCKLIQGSDGNLYGTTGSGGPGGGGTIFEIEVGLPVPAPQARSFQPSSGAKGTEVMIWGDNLLSATVSFNGVAGKDVHSSGSNYVWAEVPAGATTGPITVTTPGGTSRVRSSSLAPSPNRTPMHNSAQLLHTRRKLRKRTHRPRTCRGIQCHKSSSRPASRKSAWCASEGCTFI
jgi:uncharacterized repeat protein (TIGR03803 family)